MASQYYTPLSNGLQSFVDASPEYEFADAGIGSFREQASRLAEFGRNGDIYVVHAAEGETVIPTEVLEANPKVRELLFEQMRGMGLDPQGYIVGNELNSRNPVTGMPEFFFKSVFEGVKKAAKNVWKVAKKVAPIVLPIAAAMFGVPFLGPMFGAGTFGASFVGSGIGSLIGGASVKDSIKSGLMAGATTAAFQGLGGAFSDTGTFAGGIEGSLTGKTPVFAPGQFDQQIGTQVAASPYAESKYAFNVGGYDPKVITAGQAASDAQLGRFATGDVFGGAKSGTVFDPVAPGDRPGFLDAPGFGANAPKLSAPSATLQANVQPLTRVADANAGIKGTGQRSLNSASHSRADLTDIYGPDMMRDAVLRPPGVRPPVDQSASALLDNQWPLLSGSPTQETATFDLLGQRPTYKPPLQQITGTNAKVSLGAGGGGGGGRRTNLGDGEDSGILDTVQDYLVRGGESDAALKEKGQAAAERVWNDPRLKGINKNSENYFKVYQRAEAARAAAEDPGYLATYGPTLGLGTLAYLALNKEEKEQRLASLEEERNRRNRLLQESPEDFVVSDLDTGQFSSSAPSNLIVPSAYPFDPAPRRRQVMFGNQGGLAQYPRREMLVEGPGTERSDDIPAMLSDGEFVLNARSVRGADPTGQGNRHRGAQNLYRMMRDFEMRV